MRPKKRVLLVGENEYTLGPLRFILRNKPRYRVTSASTAREALNALSEKSYHIMLCQKPVSDLKELISKAGGIDNSMPVLILTQARPPYDDSYEDKVLCNPTTAEILRSLKYLIKAKRGPRKGSPEAMRCAHNRKTATTESYALSDMEVAA